MKKLSYLPKLKSEGLLPPSGVCGTGAPGAPNIWLGDPGEGAILRKLPAVGRALNALPPEEDTTGAVPKFKRSPNWFVRPPNGSCWWDSCIRVGGGGLGVGLTGPTGGPDPGAPAPEPVGPGGARLLGPIWAKRG